MYDILGLFHFYPIRVLHFGGGFNSKTIIPPALVAYEMIIAMECLLVNQDLIHCC